MATAALGHPPLPYAAAFICFTTETKRRPFGHVNFMYCDFDELLILVCRLGKIYVCSFLFILLYSPYLFFLFFCLDTKEPKDQNRF